ncbi:hypothetical protein FRX31_032937 [Thalictrum thalictroides]|uniref:Uncharacterized protein n=1 Tax=Thalictrum thalictroides TaxID=46969 RepID=A0A7J6UY28_THATH|nr:hypothetical protein FRX31_032937 [Thalictrum thalictroides]
MAMCCKGMRLQEEEPLIHITSFSASPLWWKIHEMQHTIEALEVIAENTTLSSNIACASGQACRDI